MWGLWKKSDMLCNIWQCSYNMGIWNKGKGRHDVKKDVLKLTARDSICYKAGIARQKGEKWEGREVLNIVWTCSPVALAVESMSKQWLHHAWAEKVNGQAEKEKRLTTMPSYFYFCMGTVLGDKTRCHLFSNPKWPFFNLEFIKSFNCSSLWILKGWKQVRKPFQVSSNFITAQQRITPKSNIRIEALLWSNSLHLKQA